MPRRLWTLASCLWIATGCASLGLDSDDDANVRTHYTLREGRRTVHAAPLPVETEILVDWYRADGSKQTVTGFRGYDFGGDERFEMVEVLNEDGSIQSLVYDFDGDGRVDQVDTPAHVAKAAPVVETPAVGAKVPAPAETPKGEVDPISGEVDEEPLAEPAKESAAPAEEAE